MSNMQEKAAAYVPLNTRLQTLKTRLDVPEYNEQQRLLFPNNCENLAKDVYKKVCRFITDCEVPSTDLCIVAVNYKETVPPSHPRESLPINLLAELQTCCEAGRIACPELIMYSIEPERETEEMLLYKKANLGIGDLKLGIDFKSRIHCCESEDSWEEGLESVDFIEVLPSINLDFSCEFGSFEFSSEYLESIELCYKRLEFLRKYHIWLDVCNNELNFDAKLEPVAEHCVACDTEYEISTENSIENACGNLTVKVKKNVTIDWCTPDFKEEFSIELSQECGSAETYESTTETEVFCLHGAYLKYKLKEKVTVDWCSGEISLEPELETECSCEPILGTASSFPIDITIPGCSQGAGEELKIEGSGIIQSILQPDGTISSSVYLPPMTATGKLGVGAGISFVKDITKKGSKLHINFGYMRFTNGLLCEVTDSPDRDIDIDCTSNIDCKKLRKKCQLCECSDSESSSSSSASGSSSSTSISVSSSSGDNCWTISIPPTADVYDFKFSGATIKDANGSTVDVPVLVRPSYVEDHFVHWEGIVPHYEGELKYSGSTLCFSTDTLTHCSPVTLTKGCDVVWSDSSSSSTGSISDSSSSGSSSSSAAEPMCSITIFADYQKPHCDQSTESCESYEFDATRVRVRVGGVDSDIAASIHEETDAYIIYTGTVTGTREELNGEIRAMATVYNQKTGAYEGVVLNVAKDPDSLKCDTDEEDK